MPKNKLITLVVTVLIILLAGFSLWQLLTRPPLETGADATPAPSVSPPPGGVTAQEADFVWEARPDGTAVLLAYTGAAETIILPEKLGGLPLRRVGDGAFRDCGTVAAVTVPEGVTEIGDYAFYTSSLSRLTLPASLTEIGSWAVPRGTTVFCPAGSAAAAWCERRSIPHTEE